MNGTHGLELNHYQLYPTRVQDIYINNVYLYPKFVGCSYSVIMAPSDIMYGYVYQIQI